MSAEVAGLEAEVKEYKLQLETVQLGLQADPENAELKDLKTELEEVITLTEAAIAELKPAPAPAQPKKPSPPPVKEKWSKENHPAYQAGYRPPPPPPPPEEQPVTLVSFNVNDNVLARWKSGDGAFYPARITTMTGSSSNPVYIVSFKNYNTTETLREKDIRPLANDDSRKRKADGPPGISASPTPPPNPSVILAAANINPELASQRKEPSKVSDGPTRPTKVPRKVKANKELEAGKAKWQDFAAKGKFGKGKKESMFRTGEGVNARVGFTGSGHEMRKDPTRSRHIYQHNGDDD